MPHTARAQPAIASGSTTVPLRSLAKVQVKHVSQVTARKGPIADALVHSHAVKGGKRVPGKVTIPQITQVTARKGPIADALVHGHTIKGGKRVPGKIAIPKITHVMHHEHIA